MAVAVLALAMLASCKKTPIPKREPDLFAPPEAVRGLVLPLSSARARPTEGLRVYVTQTGLFAGAPPTMIAPVPPEADRAKGFDVGLKRAGVHDLYVVPLAAVVPPNVEQAVLYVDKDVPYRMIVEVMFTLGQQKVSRFELVARSTTDKSGQAPVVGLRVLVPKPSCAMIAATLGAMEAGPPPCSAEELAKPRLGLTALLVKDGIALKARGGNVAPGCNDVGPGLAIAKRPDGSYDFDTLRACVAKVKAATPEAASDHEIVITASADVAYASVVATMDAVRGDADGGVLFDDVMFGVAR